MGEAKRKRQHQTQRTWAQGKLRVEANDVFCFDWSGTKQDAIELQKSYLDAVNALGVSARSYADRAGGYLMCFGAPKTGQPRLMPTGFGEKWEAHDVELHRLAVLWAALHEHIPNTGLKLEDIFVGKVLKVILTGNREQLLADTEREQRGQPLSGKYAGQMMVAVAGNYPLDPDEAVCMNQGDLFTLAKGSCPEALRDDPVYVPRIPRNAAEALAMVGMMTITADVTKPGANPEDTMRTYAGYTDEELRRGRPAVFVR